MNREIWEFINSFAPWLSGVGTLLVVIVSLYLARRDRQIRLEIRATIMKVYGIFETDIDVVSITITNLGFRTAAITGVWWSIGLLRKHPCFQVFPQYDEYHNAVRPKITDGEQVEYIIKLSDFDKNLDIFGEILSKLFLRFSIWTMKIVVFTTTGKYFKSRLSKPLRRHLLQNIQKARQP